MSRELIGKAVALLVSYREYTGDCRIANVCGEIVEALKAELAKHEQELDYPPECTTPEMEVAYAAGWWKALEVQRNKQQALDKKADNARELGLDYETDHGFDRTASHMAGEYVSTNEQNLNISEERVYKMCICEHIQRCTVFDKCMKEC